MMQCVADSLQLIIFYHSRFTDIVPSRTDNCISKKYRTVFIISYDPPQLPIITPTSKPTAAAAAATT